MRILISLGDASLRKSTELDAVSAISAGMTTAARGIHTLLDAGHQVVVAHGHDVSHLAGDVGITVPVAGHLDEVEAVSEGLVGYRLEQELRNLSEAKESFVTVLSQTLVSAQDVYSPPRRCLVGPIVDKTRAEALERRHHWVMQAVDEGWQRAVPCPKPIATLQLPAIRTLVNAGHSVICAGGGLAVVRDLQGRLSGVDALVDKDLASAQLALALDMDALLIVTDVTGVYDDWTSSTRKVVPRIAMDDMALDRFDDQSIRPKLEAAKHFAESGGFAAIGLVGQELAILEGRTGTRVVEVAATA